LDQQIQTFKALCDNASFDAQLPPSLPAAARPGGVAQAPARPGEPTSSGGAIHINVHIHLPENKTRRDYEAMIEDIGRYIFGRTELGHRDE
jgi:hypothetical protein